MVDVVLAARTGPERSDQREADDPQLDIDRCPHLMDQGSSIQDSPSSTGEAGARHGDEFAGGVVGTASGDEIGQ